MDRALVAEELATSDGLLQRLDPRAKVIGLLALVISVALARAFAAIGIVFIIALALAALSHVPLRLLLKRVWLGVLFFTGCIALPAIFLTPGNTIARLPLLNWPVTLQGLRSAGFLIARVETATTLSLLLVLCTPWTHVLKALRVLGVPVVFIVILGMTHRYIYLLMQTARDMYEARRSRLIGEPDGALRRRVAVSNVGVLLTKTFDLSNDVYLAMQARGFRGEVYTLDDFRWRVRDAVALIALLSAAIAVFWLGHV